MTTATTTHLWRVANGTLELRQRRVLLHRCFEKADELLDPRSADLA
jgi:hypothetical protein